MIGMNPNFAAEQAVLRQKAAEAAAELQAFNDAELVAQRSVLQTDNDDVKSIEAGMSEFLTEWRPKISELERHVALGGVVADPLAGRVASLESHLAITDNQVSLDADVITTLAAQLADLSLRIDHVQAVITQIGDAIPPAPTNLVKTVIAILLAIKAKIPTTWLSSPSP